MDGNKRTALSVCFWFLENNEHTLHAENEELYQFTLAIASGEMDKDAVTNWMQEHVQPL